MKAQVQKLAMLGVVDKFDKAVLSSRASGLIEKEGTEAENEDGSQN